jgi:acyl phosphate:glycerol-3-phosphate acyltransferase
MLWLVVAGSYIIGALPTALFIKGKGWRGPSARGAVFFASQIQDALWWLAVETGKGMTAAGLGLLAAGWSGAVAASIAVVLGQVAPVFPGFRGGKGAAVAAGTLVVLSPLLIVVGLAAYGICLVLTRYLSFSTMAAVVTVMVAALFFFPKLYLLMVVLPVGTLILYRYREDWKRWRRGFESPFVWKGPRHR